MKARYISTCPQFKRQSFFQTIEKSNLLTYFTTDFTNLSLKLKLVIESDAKELVRSLFIESVVETVMTILLCLVTGSKCSSVHWIFFIIWCHVQQNLASSQNIHRRSSPEENGEKFRNRTTFNFLFCLQELVWLQAIKDIHLLLIVVSLVAIDVVFFSVWVGKDPFLAEILTFEDQVGYFFRYFGKLIIKIRNTSQVDPNVLKCMTHDTTSSSNDAVLVDITGFKM